MSDIRETVARIMCRDFTGRCPDDAYNNSDGSFMYLAWKIPLNLVLTNRTINAFLEVAAEQDWHMQPDEATEKMIEAIMGGTEEFEPDMVRFCRHWKARDYRAMLEAAPKFEWSDE